MARVDGLKVSVEFLNPDRTSAGDQFKNLKDTESKDVHRMGYKAKGHSYAKEEHSTLEKIAVVFANATVGLLGLAYFFNKEVKKETRRVLFGEVPVAKIDGQYVTTYYTDTTAPKKLTAAERETRARALGIKDEGECGYAIDEKNSQFIIVPRDENGKWDFAKSRALIVSRTNGERYSYAELVNWAKIWITDREAIEKTLKDNNFSHEFVLLVEIEDGSPQLSIKMDNGLNTDLKTTGHKVSLAGGQIRTTKEMMEKPSSEGRKKKKHKADDDEDSNSGPYVNPVRTPSAPPSPVSKAPASEQKDSPIQPTRVEEPDSPPPTKTEHSNALYDEQVD